MDVSVRVFLDEITSFISGLRAEQIALQDVGGPYIVNPTPK